jgi:hypothetical protein
MPEKEKKPESTGPISRREFAMGSMAVIGAYTSFAQEPPEPLSAAAKALKIGISSDVQKLLDDRHIIEEDIRRVIEHAEATGLKLYEEGSNRFLSKLRIYEAMFYVEYSSDQGVYRIHTAYFHRFKLDEEEQ